MSIIDWSQCPGCLGQAVVTLRLPCAIVESTRRHKHVPIVNIASLRSRSIKRRRWKQKNDYYGVFFAHLSSGCGINAKAPLGWIQISESRTRVVAIIPLGLKPSRDSSQRDSPSEYFAIEVNWNTFWDKSWYFQSYLICCHKETIKLLGNMTKNLWLSYKSLVNLIR